MAKSMTGENSSDTFTCRRFLEDDRSVLGVAWKSSISARYSGFFVVIAISGQRMLRSSAHTDVIVPRTESVQLGPQGFSSAGPHSETVFQLT